MILHCVPGTSQTFDAASANLTIEEFKKRHPRYKHYLFVNLQGQCIYDEDHDITEMKEVKICYALSRPAIQVKKFHAISLVSPEHIVVGIRFGSTKEYCQYVLSQGTSLKELLHHIKLHPSTLVRSLVTGRYVHDDRPLQHHDEYIVFKLEQT